MISKVAKRAVDRYLSERIAAEPENLLKISDDVVILDLRQDPSQTKDEIAEAINRALGFETMESEFETRGRSKGIYIGPRDQAEIYRMKSIDESIYVGSRSPMTPAETQALVKKHLGL